MNRALAIGQLEASTFALNSWGLFTSLLFDTNFITLGFGVLSA